VKEGLILLILTRFMYHDWEEENKYPNHLSTTKIGGLPQYPERTSGQGKLKNERYYIVIFHLLE
jgi:hypothetical protein